MNEENFLDHIPGGILKLKIDKNFTVLYSNQSAKTLFQIPSSLKDMVCESEFPELSERINGNLEEQTSCFELEFKAKNPEKVSGTPFS